jgi:hypothetical protein
VIALVTAINQALFSLAPGLFGLLHDLAGGFGAPLLAALALQIASAAIVLIGRPKVATSRIAVARPAGAAHASRRAGCGTTARGQEKTR